MRKAWSIFRTVMSVILLLAVVMPVGIYVVFSTPAIQDEIRSIASSELSKLLGAEVGIGRLEIHPFNRLSVEDMSLTLPDGDTVASIHRVSAGFELRHLLMTGEIIIDYALLDGATLSVSRDSTNAPLNIQTIIDRLKSDRKDEEPSNFDLKISTVVVRDMSASYDVRDRAPLDSGRFDASHIKIENLSLNAYIPQLSRDCYAAEIDHLSFKEHNGFELSNLKVSASIDSTALQVSGLSLSLPHSTLSFKPITIPTKGINGLGEALRNHKTRIISGDDCSIFLPDLAPFIPALNDFPTLLALRLEADGCSEAITIERLAIHEPATHAVSLNLGAEITGIDTPNSITVDIKRLSAIIRGPECAAIGGNKISGKISSLLQQTATQAVALKGYGNIDGGRISLKTDGDAGNADIDANYINSRLAPQISCKGELRKINVGLLVSSHILGLADASFSGKIRIRGKQTDGTVNAAINRLDILGHSYSGITLDGRLLNSTEAEIQLDTSDKDAQLALDASAGFGKDKYLIGTISGRDIDLDALGLYDRRPGLKLNTDADIALSCTDIDDIEGSVEIRRADWTDSEGKGLVLPPLSIEADPYGINPGIEITSDKINASIAGKYKVSTLLPSLKEMAATSLPALFPEPIKSTKAFKGSRKTKRDKKAQRPDNGGNDFTFDISLNDVDTICNFFALPFAPLGQMTVNGYISHRRGTAAASVDIPFLRQGNNKIIDNTQFDIRLDTTSHNGRIYLTAEIPTQKGTMAVAGLIGSADNRINTRLDWKIERRIPLNGTIDFTTLLSRDNEKELAAEIEFNPGTINFGDEVWHIKPAHLSYSPPELKIKNFALDTGKQSIAIEGNVGALESDSIEVWLSGISLLPIFETLEIDNVLISGLATGSFIGHSLLSPAPFLRCESLHVDSIGYNRCTLGDADVAAFWDNEKKAFSLDADIIEPEGAHSRIKGDIFPLAQALDLRFHASHVRVGFLKPFMSAFSSDISGHASGYARLFGTFKEIDLEGDIFADNLNMKVDFTNTTYATSDSVHIRPGRIIVDNATVYDINGHTARLSGRVDHHFFKEPTFRFELTDAIDFLSYNGTRKQNPDWYGTIYGNGRALITGRPGVVDIGVRMTTAPGSHFTFVLSDRRDADEYKFITFRDITPDSLKPSAPKLDFIPASVRRLREKKTELSDESASAFNLDLNVDITPDARMTLVMDPVAGDEIKANGSGDMRLTYKSLDNDMRMYGTYTLEDGSYNFTLQDIIIKDFTIKADSKISFNGDPYDASLDLAAYYALNANLSDLDESFLQDKELNRTNVPVHALMKVTGGISQPNIDFDLEFPTLTSDTYRKVRSIVSTRDMMNRQIIYLLALNRFYTPDYMASTTKGNELFSVASSTISSQLGSMLGKLSENWSIAPNLRSDRGDFSDVEVDVALSSRLLNNRLLFNGNFGYRDKSMNTNQFVGDFDIEYLLNRRGTWRLKAYNRYNDRNYYVRSAQTTQGIGIMFKRDFDNIFSFLRRKKKTTLPEAEAADSVRISE